MAVCPVVSNCHAGSYSYTVYGETDESVWTLPGGFCCFMPVRASLEGRREQRKEHERLPAEPEGGALQELCPRPSPRNVRKEEIALEIHEMAQEHVPAVLSMMREFYSSDAVSTNGSEEIFMRDIKTCLSRGPYLRGFVFETDGNLAGYAMTSQSYNTEFARPCLWIEDVYIRPEHRGRGIASQFLSWLIARHPDKLLRLEVEENNEQAISVYRKAGFDRLPYVEYKRNP